LCRSASSATTSLASSAPGRRRDARGDCFGSTWRAGVELTAADFERAIPRRLRERLVRGELESGDDVVALRRFTGLSQVAFATALGINVRTLRNGEQGRRMPAGPALALLRIVARHPKVLRENLALVG
jgi:putative transcriptional regulator